MSLKTKANDRFRNFSRRFKDKEEAPTTAEAITRKQLSGVNGGRGILQTIPIIREPAGSSTAGSTSVGTASTLGGSTNPSTTGTASTVNSSGSSPYHLRPPTLHRKFSILHSSSKDFVLPDLPWLCGTWHVVYSTLPMWKNKRNVRITYTRLAGNKLDDLVTYQTNTDKEIQKVHGIDSPKKDGRYVWRGKGMLMVASSRWEVLGWGGGGPRGDEEWVVTYFAKTMFTPAGIDIYSRKMTGLNDGLIEKLKGGLEKIAGQATDLRTGDSSEDGTMTAADWSRLVKSLFEVKVDGSRQDEGSVV